VGFRFVRQAGLRIAGRFSPGLDGQLPLEGPETHFVSPLGAVNPGGSFTAGRSAAACAAPVAASGLARRRPAAAPCRSLPR
jgi:hypothetical protein